LVARHRGKWRHAETTARACKRCKHTLHT
jgi:hypothetical protein